MFPNPFFPEKPGLPAYKQSQIFIFIWKFVGFCVGVCKAAEQDSAFLHEKIHWNIKRKQFFCVGEIIKQIFQEGSPGKKKTVVNVFGELELLLSDHINSGPDTLDV